jgi:Uma2 family endonuclease
MTTATAKRRMTEAEFLALPDDGVRRWLVNGEVREYGMTVRNQDHSIVESCITCLLGEWLKRQPLPRGAIASGEVGFRLPGDPGVVVGLDVAYLDAEMTAKRKESASTLFEGVPILAVEVLSPSDTMEHIRDRIALLLKAGVKIVWIVDTHDQTVRVRRKGVRSQTLEVTQELTAEPELPGFRVPVASLFSW